MRGLEPLNLPFTKRLLYQLSYIGLSFCEVLSRLTEQIITLHTLLVKHFFVDRTRQKPTSPRCDARPHPREVSFCFVLPAFHTGCANEIELILTLSEPDDEP